MGEGRPPSRRKDLRGRARALLRPLQRPPVGLLDGLLRARDARGPDGQHRRDPTSLLLGLRGGFLGVPGGRHEGNLALLASAKSRRGAGRDLELGQLGASGPLPGAVPVERRGVRRGGDGGEGGPLRLRMGRGGHRGTPRELLQRPRHVGTDVLPERRRRARRGNRLYEPPHGAGARAGGELPVAEVVSGGADADGRGAHGEGCGGDGGGRRRADGDGRGYAAPRGGGACAGLFHDGAVCGGDARGGVRHARRGRAAAGPARGRRLHGHARSLRRARLRERARRGEGRRRRGAPGSRGGRCRARCVVARDDQDACRFGRGRTGPRRAAARREGRRRRRGGCLRDDAERGHGGMDGNRCGGVRHARGDDVPLDGRLPRKQQPVLPQSAEPARKRTLDDRRRHEELPLGRLSLPGKRRDGAQAGLRRGEHGHVPGGRRLRADVPHGRAHGRRRLPVCGRLGQGLARGRRGRRDAGRDGVRLRGRLDAEAALPRAWRQGGRVHVPP